ncbi:hypothetical protein [Bradyrhizobium sp. URHC0002]
MTNSLPEFVEQSLQIAWDFLEASGEISDPHRSAEVLLMDIRDRAFKGERRPLMLANRAIEKHKRTEGHAKAIPVREIA